MTTLPDSRPCYEFGTGPGREAIEQTGFAAALTLSRTLDVHPAVAHTTLFDLGGGRFAVRWFPTAAAVEADQTRQARAVAEGEQYVWEQLGDQRYRVQTSSGRRYYVSAATGCSCPDYGRATVRGSGAVCKHLHAARLSGRLHAAEVRP